MLGLMMDEQLTVTSLMTHAKSIYSDSEIVSVTHDHDRFRYTFGECFDRAAQLANAMQKLGVVEGDMLGTLAWNDHRHMEIYYAACCAGNICHTINPRLFPEQLSYIINHAQDKWIFVDPMFVPLLEGLADQIAEVAGFIVLSSKESMPETRLPNVYCYEELIANESIQFDWPKLDENTACSLCYTSGTTGNPKGVLYSHRALVLQCYAACLGGAMAYTNQDTVLPIVPMFHVNAWNVPYSAALAGFNIVFPGSKMGDGETLQALIEEEGVTRSAGVPTVWLSLLNYLRETGKRIDSLKSVVVGGSACPLSTMEEFENEHGVYSHVGWGMTEMAPLGTYNTLKKPRSEYTDAEYAVIRLKAGRPIFGVQMKIIDEQGNDLPWDGVAFGALLVKGPWVVKNYFKKEGQLLDDDGWFDTGDVATIDSDGYMAITDRTKDVIKSGGEWISSIDLENCAMGHPDVLEAGVIGIAHPKWDERPLLVVVRMPGATVTDEQIIEYMTGKVAKWCLPDEVVFVDELPHTATGKIHKVGMREQFADYQFAK
ncbi:MAG: acyl-CoA synthetase (AMP-forming)/AMP-acid ligase II [Arenicella sp.]|jgi:acyl-CoA synthetase (AMP-forming)/AMP-acid ligase II